MTVLGSYPSRRYSRSWITQRVINRIPPWALARQSPISTGQQMINPIALEIQDTYQQLAKARYDQFLSTADMSQLDSLYRCDLLTGMEFQYNTSSNGDRIYIPPSVYGTLNGTEYQITQAEDNDIKTLAYDNLPSRIEDAEVSYTYTAVVPETTIANLPSVSPNDLYIYSHLYITIKNNSTWEERTNKNIYFSKVSITGITRKGTEVTEVVPIRYNGTFKTINEWKEISSVFVSYLDNTATITIETFPINRESYLDNRNIFVDIDGSEKYQFTKLNNARAFGSTFLAESFVLADMNIVRTGLDDKDTSYEIELLDESSSNVDLVDYIHRPNSRYIYGVDTDTFYVYDVDLPYPDTLDISQESDNGYINLVSERWLLARGETAEIKTINNNISDVPWRVRWHVLDPDDNEYYMGLDGTFWPTSTSAWIENDKWSDAIWDDQIIHFLVTKTGRYIIKLEAEYFNELTNTTSLKYKNFIFFVPAITPEVQFTLPVALQNSTNITIDSDHNIWLIKSGTANKLEIFYDYFLVDYTNSRLYTKEEYSSVRITI